jgi:hypothetical protein
MKNTVRWLIGLSIGIFGCSDSDLPELDFVSVTIQTPMFENFNAVQLVGQVLDLGNISSGTCGFVWSYDRNNVESLQNDTIKVTLSLTQLESDGRFSVMLRDLAREKTIYVRAFVNVSVEKTGDRQVFSEKIESFTVGEIVANTGKALVLNDSVVVYGQLRGIENQEVVQHGHVISKDEKAPTLGCATCLTFNRGSSNDNNVFSSHFAGLEFNTLYYSRAYAIAKSDTFYAKTVDSIQVLDGWSLITPFPYGYAEGGVATLNGKAYAGFGCKKALGCLYGDLVTDFWQFNPADNNGAGDWTPAAQLSVFTQKRYNATLFSTSGKVHAVFGEYYENGESNVLNDFSSLDINTGGWSDTDISSAFPKGRTGAVAFSLLGKIYIGSGRDFFYKELNDFQEFDPSTGMWRPVASLPLQKSPVAVIENLGRYEAVAFTVGGYAYVGSGQYGALALRDFWRFQPPALENSFMGEWQQVAFLPPEAKARYQAAAFAIGEKGYVGSGYNPTEGYLKDWWQFNPAENAWIPRAAFPSVARTNAMAFDLGGFGYFGTGHTRVLLNGGLNATEYSLNDFWRYTPEN